MLANVIAVVFEPLGARVTDSVSSRPVIDDGKQVGGARYEGFAVIMGPTACRCEESVLLRVGVHVHELRPEAGKIARHGR